MYGSVHEEVIIEWLAALLEYTILVWDTYIVNTLVSDVLYM